MAWLLLGMACVFEVAFALGAKGSHGFTRLVPSIVTLVGAAGGVLSLGLALRDLDLAIGYATWTSVGAGGTAVGSALIFAERMTVQKIASIVAIIAGVIGLLWVGAA